MMTFTKSPAPDPIPREGIGRAVALMQSGLLFRYGPQLPGGEETAPAAPPDEPVSEVAQLELELGRYTGHHYVIAVNSCGSALFLSLKAAGLQPGGKVFTNAFSFTAVPSSIVHASGVPIYVECTADYVMDLDDLGTRIRAHPDAGFAIVSHMRGHVADMDRLAAICAHAGIVLIEDCAHSLGARWQTQQPPHDTLVGHHGRLACFSSQSAKLMNSGEGGFVATDDAALAAYCMLGAGCYESLYRQHLARPGDDHRIEDLKRQVPNFSLRMSNLTAAALRPQLPCLEDRIRAYDLMYRRLARILAAADSIRLPVAHPQAVRVGDSIQFNLVHLSAHQVRQFTATAAAHGVPLQIFGDGDNARDFRNWHYSFEEPPVLARTQQTIARACDLKLSLSFTASDIDLIGYLIKDALYQAEAVPTAADYPTALTDRFADVDAVVSIYDAWAASYDADHRRNGWRVILNHLAYTATLCLSGDAPILDLGCGTGLLGRELRSFGFEHLCGLDVSTASLALAETAGTYHSLHRKELGQPLDFASNSFAALVASGVFTRRQVPLDALDEVLRVLRPGGLFIVVLRVEDDGFYADRITEYIAAGRLFPIRKDRLGVLQSCSHELLLLRKT